MSSVAKIVSGGQTGADRGGLDAAIELGIPHGGWCPKGRKAEAGVIPAKYRLVETDSAGYVARTGKSVIDGHRTTVSAYDNPGGVALAKRPPWLADYATHEQNQCYHEENPPSSSLEDEPDPLLLIPQAEAQQQAKQA